MPQHYQLSKPILNIEPSTTALADYVKDLDFVEVCASL